MSHALQKTTVSVAIAALILGKAVLIADMLPWINRYPAKPLIYNVAWKTSIYTLVSAVIHYLEHLYDFARAAGGTFSGNEKLPDAIIWPHFSASQIMLVVLILIYCTMRELVRVIGRQKVLRTFFGPLPLPRY
jgi:hypothetical protein